VAVIPTSPELLLALRGSHTRTVRVAALYDGAPVSEQYVPVSGGQLTLDLDDDATVTCELELADPTWLATGPTSLLLPFGHRLRALVGVRVGRSWEWLPAGPQLLVTVVPTESGPSSTFKVTARSLIRQVQDDRFTVPYQPTGTIRACITALLTAAVPGAPVTHVGGDASVPAGLVYETDRWAAVADLAARVDAVVRPTGDGFTVAPAPQPSGTPVWTVDAGDDGVLLSGARPVVARDDAYNAVVASNPDDPAVWAIATIDEPGHPLRWGGPFGRRPYFFSSPLLTAATVQAAADTRLANLRGRSRIVEVGAVPNPALELGDIVTVVWHPGTDGEPMMIRKIVLPLGPGDGEMRLTCQGAA
jgi:Domain of unknown function (DUF5047)